MSDESAQLEHRDRPAGGGLWLIVILVVLPLLYVLSPPWVALMLGPRYYEVDWFLNLYSPLIYLDTNVDLVSEFYQWYFELVMDY